MFNSRGHRYEFQVALIGAYRLVTYLHYAALSQAEQTACNIVAG